MTDGPYPLPPGWRWVRLGELCQIIMGQSPPSLTYNTRQQGLPFFQGKADFRELYPEPRIWCSSPQKLSELGDVLISVRAPVGPTNLANELCCIGRGLAALRPSDGLERMWLLYYLRSVGSELEGLGKGTAFAAITKRQLAELPIPLPPLDEQRRIVAKVEALMERVREAKHLRAEAEADTDTILHAAIADVFSDILPDRMPLLDVLSEKPRNGWSPRCDNAPDGTPVLKLGAVLNFRFNPSAIKRTRLPVNSTAHYWLTKGDILISRSNTPELVGHAAVFSGEPYPCIYPDLLMRIRVELSKADPQFIIYWLQGAEARKYIHAHAMGASSTMKKITQSDVCALPFPAIGVSDQHHIVSYLDSVQAKVTALKQAQEATDAELHRLEQAILDRAFRGEL